MKQDTKITVSPTVTNNTGNQGSTISNGARLSLSPERTADKIKSDTSVRSKKK